MAKYFAAEAGQRVVRAAQHLHGGVGVDRDYPLHRYYLWAKQLELTGAAGRWHGISCADRRAHRCVRDGTGARAAAASAQRAE